MRYLFVALLLISCGRREGVVRIAQCPYRPGDTAAEWPAHVQSDYIYTYYISPDSILRMDDTVMATYRTVVTQSVKNASLTTTLFARMLHPAYVIGRTTRTVYTFPISDDTLLRRQLPLAEATFELFYRVTDSNALDVTHLEKTPTVTIAGKPCIKGEGISKDSARITFFFTKEATGIESPLNRFVRDFPYEVMSIKFPVPWTMPDGSMSTGSVVFQVTDIRDTTLDNALFTIRK
ncbi:hypothetical protein [Dinghuibacter silviterrae]|uniref:Uncharacterized protein n=1 Tax=Dinghuibacter silviterrae TaxID=1539049 RepID=A0A4R8DTW3_9BACT|nr:hypothetical protein [Dinghuibacter silviterrae]TDX01356.1 hypothetical protein EDB95_2390 [Dinghuibacter silviterrae]